MVFMIKILLNKNMDFYNKKVRYDIKHLGFYKMLLKLV